MSGRANGKTGVPEWNAPGLDTVEPMASLSIGRREFITGATAGALAMLPGCRQHDVDAAPPAHVALTTPTPHGHVVLARPATPLDGRLGEMIACARAHGASVGISGRMLPDSTRLVPRMPIFPGDVPDRNRSNVDLMFLIESQAADLAQQQASKLVSKLAGLITPTWQAPVRHEVLGASSGRALTRNVFGFNEGFGNPIDGADATLISGSHRYPSWSIGGALLAMRIIQVSHELWDRDDPERHARIIGRHPDGKWLNGDPAEAPAPFRGDPNGAVTPIDSHIRRANPRDGRPIIQLTRRGWNYSTANDEGTLFLAYTNDISRFETAQRRVIGDALSPYTLTVGGGYYFVPPPHDGWWRRMKEGLQTPTR